MKKLLVVLLVIFRTSLAFAVQPDEMLKDPTLESRARELSSQLRCLVCQNESIDESDASLARDIRVLIRQRITQGESNEQVRDFLVSRYGDFILLRPPLKPETVLLWISAPATLIVGAISILLAARRSFSPPDVLSHEEEARIAELTESD